MPTQRGSNDALFITDSFSRNFCFNVLSLGRALMSDTAFEGLPLKYGRNMEVAFRGTLENFKLPLAV